MERKIAKGRSVKLVSPLAALDGRVISTAATYADTGRRRVAEQYHVARSICAGAVHFIRKLCSRDSSLILSKFGKSISDESMASMIVGHFRVVRTLSRCGARALTKSYPNYVNKYATNYLAKRFSKRARR